MDKAIINQLQLNRLRGARVLLRIDGFEEPGADKGPGEDKLRECLPTLEYLTEVGARLIIGAHWGNPGGRAHAR